MLTLRSVRSGCFLAILAAISCGEGGDDEAPAIESSRHKIVVAATVTINPLGFLGGICINGQGCTTNVLKSFDLAAGSYQLSASNSVKVGTGDSGIGSLAVASNGDVTLGTEVEDSLTKGTRVGIVTPLTAKIKVVTLDRNNYPGTIVIQGAGAFNTTTNQTTLLSGRRYRVYSNYTVHLTRDDPFFDTSPDLEVSPNGDVSIPSDETRKSMAFTAATSVLKLETVAITLDKNGYPGGLSFSGIGGIPTSNVGNLLLNRRYRLYSPNSLSETAYDSNFSSTWDFSVGPGPDKTLTLSGSAPTFLEKLPPSTLRFRAVPIIVQKENFAGSIAIAGLGGINTGQSLLPNRRYEIYSVYATSKNRDDNRFGTEPELFMSSNGVLDLRTDEAKASLEVVGANTLKFKTTQATFNKNLYALGIAISGITSTDAQGKIWFLNERRYRLHSPYSTSLDREDTTFSPSYDVQVNSGEIGFLNSEIQRSIAKVGSGANFSLLVQQVAINKVAYVGGFNVPGLGSFDATGKAIVLRGRRYRLAANNSTDISRSDTYFGTASDLNVAADGRVTLAPSLAPYFTIDPVTDLISPRVATLSVARGGFVGNVGITGLVVSSSGANVANQVIVGRKYTMVPGNVIETFPLANTDCTPHSYAFGGFSFVVTCTDPNNVQGAPPPTPPAAPTNFAIGAVSGSRLQATWTDNSGGTASFVIQRSDVAGPYVWNSGTAIASGTTNFTDQGLQPSWTYYYRIVAVNATFPLSTAEGRWVPVPTAASGMTLAACTGNATVQGEFCNSANRCDGTCQPVAGVPGTFSCDPATRVICPGEDQCHFASTCIPATGACSDARKPVETLCSTGPNKCRTGDTCGVSGLGAFTCLDGTADVNCNDSNSCTQDSCEPATGQCSNVEPANASCPVVPQVTCVVPDAAGGGYTAVFGYTAGTRNSRIVRGASNIVNNTTGGPASVQPPEWFKAGGEKVAFTVPVSTAQGGVTWTLGSFQAAASGASTTCPRSNLVSTSDGTGLKIGNDTYPFEYDEKKIVSGSDLATELSAPNADGTKQTAGGISGALQITDDGAAAYSMPLQAPPGRAGIQPELSVSYNSRAGNGVLGVGWALNGLSEIRVCPRSLRIDGPGPLASITDTNGLLKADAPLCLDGERLIPVNGLIAGEFRTERSDGTRIFATYDVQGRPLNLEAQTRNGRILRFGIHPSYPFQTQHLGAAKAVAADIDREPETGVVTRYVPKPLAQRNYQRFAFPLTEVSDLNGNKMIIEYTVADSEGGATEQARIAYEHHPSKIKYTSSAHHSAQRTMEFEYIPRRGEFDHSSRFFAGFHLVSTKRLSRVVFSAPRPTDAGGWASLPVSYYQFSYDDAQGSPTGRSRLHSIKRCEPGPGPNVVVGDANDVCLRPTTFRWSNASGFTEVPVNLEDLGKENTEIFSGNFLVVADRNGDGRDDIFYNSFVSENGSLYRFLQRRVWRDSTGNPAQPFSNSMPLRDANGVAVPRKISIGNRLSIPIFIDIQGNGIAEKASVDGSDDIRIGDFNGDGRMDLLKGNRTPDPSNPDPTISFWGNRYTGSGTCTTLDDGDPCLQLQSIPGVFYGQEHGFSSPSIVTMDVDGNGVTDILGAKELLLNNDRLVGDFNGDGLQDIRMTVRPESVGLPSGPASVPIGLVNAGNGFFIPSTTAPEMNREVTIDVNLDGRLDAFDIEAGKIHLSRDFDSAPPADAPFPSSFRAGHNGWGERFTRCVERANNNVHENDDIVRAASKGYGGNSICPNGPPNRTCYELGGDPVEVEGLDCSCPDNPERQGYTNGQSCWSPFAWNEDPGTFVYTRALDWNGDGLTDLFTINQSHDPVLFVRDGKPDLLEGVDEGLGSNSGIQYKPLIDSSVYTPAPVSDSTCAWPMQCVRKGMWVVSQLDVDLGVAPQPNSTAGQYHYSYANGRTDLLGRGFLGFAQRKRERIVTANADHPNTFYESEWRFFDRAFEQNDQVFPYARFLTKQETFVYDDANMPSASKRATQVTVTPQVVRGVGGTLEANEKIFRVDRLVIQRKTLQTSGEVNWNSWDHQTTDNFTRDKYGNVKNEGHIVAWVLPGATGGTSSTLVSKEFEPGGAETLDQFHQGRFLGLATKVTTEANSSNGPAPTTVIVNDWLAILGRLNSSTTQPGGGADQELKTTLDYNDEGLVTKTTQNDKTGLERSSVSTFDSLEGMFPTTSTNALGQTTRSVFQPAHGGLVWAMEPNGRISRNHYDGFGRLRRTSGAKATKVDIGYSADASSPLTVSTTASTGATNFKYHDRLGRVVETVEKAPDGTFARVKTTFDELGRPKKITRPYGGSDLVYDDFGRVVSSTSPHEDGTSVVRTVTYPSFFVRTTEQEQHRIRKETTDGLGQLVKVEETVEAKSGPDGEAIQGGIETTTYTYKPFGLLHRVDGTAAGNTEMVYDALGRRTYLKTSATGEANTKYNAFGEVREEAAANGRVRTSEPDDLGRPKFVRDVIGGVEERSDFVYDSAANGIGQLASATRGAPDLVTTTFAYDRDFGAVVGNELTLPVNAGGTTVYERIALKQTLNDNGQVDLLTYPDAGAAEGPLTVKHKYGPTGGLQGLVQPSNEANAWWQALSWDLVGRVKAEKFGNGVLSTRSYAAETGRLEGIHTATDGQAPYVNLAYAYDHFGNLKTRSDLKRNEHEGFEYDDLDRLWSWYEADSSGNRLSQGWNVTNKISRSGDIQSRSVHDAGVRTQLVTNNVVNGGSSSLWTGTFAFDASGNMTTHPALGTISYTGFNLPRKVTGAQTVDYFYDAFGTRVQKSFDGATRAQATTYLGGVYERRVVGGQVTHVIMLTAGGKVIGQISRNASTGIQETSYVYTDAMGSTTLVHPATGPLDERRQDPFGNVLASNGARIDPKLIASPPGARGPNGVTKGFTGQEEDSELGVVNMRGRIYDPRLGRFMQADPVFAAGALSQSWNRYSYVMNNPTKYVDPSGYIVVCLLTPVYLDGGRGAVDHCKEEGGAGTNENGDLAAAIDEAQARWKIEDEQKEAQEAAEAAAKEASGEGVRRGVDGKPILLACAENCYIGEGENEVRQSSEYRQGQLGALAAGIFGLSLFADAVAPGAGIAARGALTGTVGMVAYRIITSDAGKNFTSNAARGMAPRGKEIGNALIHGGLSVFDTLAGAALRVPVLAQSLARQGESVLGIAQLRLSPQLAAQMVKTLGDGHFTFTGSGEMLQNAWFQTIPQVLGRF